MASRDVPPWISVAHGSAPILLLAPHGGRRDDVRVPGRHKVNDLLTAEVTRELATACCASAIVNERLDRNQLDLNRLSQVQRDAPWLIDLLAEMLGAMVSVSGHATVLVIHGWNVTQTACDVGIGMREHESGLVSVRANTTTVSSAFVSTHLRPLQDVAAAAGIVVTIGSRYPAAHPNNLLQIFRVREYPEGDAHCPVAALCRTSNIEAAQLELAIPLRWPGPRRNQFLRMLTEMLRGEHLRDPSMIRVRPKTPVLRSSRGRVTRRRGLQFIAGEMLIMASIDVGEYGPIAGRLVISRDIDRLAVFTGELGEPSLPWAIPPLSFQSMTDNRTRVVYEGPLVAFPTHTPFLDLERGLAVGTLVDGRVDVTFRADDTEAGEECFGDVRGEMIVDGLRYEIVARGVASSSESVIPQSVPSCRITLPTSPWGALMLGVNLSAPPIWRKDSCVLGVLLGTMGGNGRVGVHVECDLQLSSPTGSLTLELMNASTHRDPIQGTIERMIPVRRSGREGTVIETIFALVRIDNRCCGWVEVSIGIDVPGPCP